MGIKGKSCITPHSCSLPPSCSLKTSFDHSQLQIETLSAEKMAAKRLFNDSDQDPDNPNDKRMKPTRPSFAS